MQKEISPEVVPYYMGICGFLIWMLLSTTCTRLHDLNKSGLYTVLWMIPLINFGLMAYTFKKGYELDNKYGPVPSINNYTSVDVKNFFLLSGRRSRSSFWDIFILLSVSAFLINIAIDEISLLFFNISLALIGWLKLVNASKRLHDLNITARWVLAIIIINEIIAYLYMANNYTESTPIPFLIVAGLIYLFLGLKKGTVGVNKYGPDPLGENKTKNDDIQKSNDLSSVENKKDAWIELPIKNNISEDDALHKKDPKNNTEALRELHQLYKEDILTEEEFNLKKKELLDKM